LNQILKGTFMAVALLVLSATAGAEEKEKVFAGTVEINSTQFAFLISGKAGGGTLEFQGKEYQFDLAGLGVGGFGVQSINAVGAVYNMTDISQFNGVYTQARMGVTVGTAASGAMSLGNTKGVLIDLKVAGSKGLSLGLGVDGVSITLKK
jgi:hypothetical protein